MIKNMCQTKGGKIMIIIKIIIIIIQRSHFIVLLSMDILLYNTKTQLAAEAINQAWKRGKLVTWLRMTSTLRKDTTLSRPLGHIWPTRIDLWTDLILPRGRCCSAGLHTADTLWHACIDFLTYSDDHRQSGYVRVESGRDRPREEICGSTDHFQQFWNGYGHQRVKLNHHQQPRDTCLNKLNFCKPSCDDVTFKTHLIPEGRWRQQGHAKRLPRLNGKVSSPEGTLLQRSMDRRTAAWRWLNKRSQKWKCH